MRLSIAERLVLLEILPKEGDYASLKEIHKARMVLGFTNDELREYEIAQDGSQIRWNDSGNGYLADVPLSEWLTTTVQELLRELNKKKKLTDREFPLYEKFIVAYDQV